VATVELEHLTLYYGKVLAVNDLSLRIEDKELCILLGPTGCGKTSTMRMIAGLETPTKGIIRLDGRVINGLYPGDRDVAMVFQNYALYPHMTIKKQFAYPLKAKKVARQEIEQRVQQTADFLQLSELLDRYPSELSVGQQQRIAIGRALIRRPKLFLMDEPLGQLDARMRAEMRANLKHLQRLGDKIVVMQLGVIQQVGTPAEIYNQPANLFVAGFIGTPSMNFLNCSVQGEGETLRVQNDHVSIGLAPATAQKVQSSSAKNRFVLGIRPEHIRLTPQTEQEATPAEVYVVEPYSNEYVVGLKIAKHLFKVRQDRKKLGFKPQVGQTVWMKFLHDKMHLFDAETEICLT
jgi:ABC-type sugar transport system ATPase subunit